ncbi:histidine phosphatase family protein [Aestuariispira ectoiniformans]|uniref:histidine phosphatase family protein n=1 Tax=Aestuariispira ectoiniformans TaxID=2775080 RepID=UPI00223BD3EC|nr:histidine phosphatase family protein [Aestuariispira ectoiniformans]
MYPELFVIRHGETHWNREQRLQGHKNSSLTDLGRDQALQQGRILQNLDMKAREDIPCFCSPLDRAQETAWLAMEAISKPFQTDDRLKEIALGDWEGCKYSEVHSATDRNADNYMDRVDWFSAPGGESYEAAVDRAKAFLETLSGPTIIVTHGVFSAVLRGVWLGLPRRDALALSKAQGCIFHLKGGRETILQQ